MSESPDYFEAITLALSNHSLQFNLDEKINDTRFNGMGLGMIGFETYHCGDYLIKGLWETGQIKHMLHDGGDIIWFEKTTGEHISIHLIDSSIERYEIRKTLAENSEKGIYTLFMLWATMMIPPQGKLFKMADWMEGFLALNNGCTYGYDLIQGEVYIFPVMFRGEGAVRLTEYGLTIDFKNLACRKISTMLPNFSDTWLIADFLGVSERHEIPAAEMPPRAETAPEITGLEPYYVLLGVKAGDDVETIRQAYRGLARRYHPDTNPDPNANEQMTRINQAYQKIMDTLEGQGLKDL